MNVLIKQTCMTFDPDYGTIESISYSTTLTADMPVTDAILIITDFVDNCLKHLIVRTASTAPAAPSRWPIADLVEDIETFFIFSPNRRLTASASPTSPAGVEVPCALI